MKKEILKSFGNFYKKKVGKIYPNELALRTFLGKNKFLSLDKKKIKNKKILDLGYGDGRNLEFFYKIGMETHGLEISKEIISKTKKNLKNKKIKYHKGFCQKTNLKKDTFDFIFADCVFMYLRSTKDNMITSLNESYRILKKNGYLFCVVVNKKSTILKDAKKIKNNIYLISNDPLNIRNKILYYAYEKLSDLQKDLKRSKFQKFKIFKSDIDYYGTRKFHYIVLLKKY